ncbi:MAG: Na(+)/H(+) antiporter subunit B [Bacillota bacterium]|uniref:Na(+)/H(+) antiporter subunit B n=1 Tax=Virgibacillus salarius TaxID=447199 RepID=A0A941DT21_9BACI|nr:MULTISPECIES: Na(+)/H(+) antiporter subunit B [Bacillaceae]NAZ08883.1 Na(+)/H(+) antiporter subunit B [Agaribacter marinus]MBR7796175.1 Na(+)/H(+) antiporter subunit B [Virgibacillus salarius]MCC2249688.1 Na(+)/H(+) antiporter subunit B [Virgibacillus sp. AGTR]MDY7042679.1 Na(+)/H(+) antiporter subunit B [Virgibacillus sp. M23]QRZ17133.1 Na(+)/H(+) antiporter subunit B [Virgibacillus sp. AGTR]
MYKPNDLILRTTSSLIAFILLGFAVYLLLAGHNSPGGGFVGGLMTSGAILLMNMSYGADVVKKVLPIDFTKLIPIGLAIAVGTGVGSFLFKAPFLSQTYDYYTFPIFGKIELATAMIFDIGVYLTVVGVMMTIILTIANDQD